MNKNKENLSKIKQNDGDKPKENSDTGEILNADNDIESQNVKNKDSETVESTNTEQQPAEQSIEKTEEKINYKEEVSKLLEEKLRLLAEMENLRKRSQKEKIDSSKYGSSNLARDILSPGDNLKRALESYPEDQQESPALKNLVDGIKMVLKEFETTLEKHGINKINAVNEKFDHNLHQAMFEVETDDKPEGVVVEEVQCGYTMHDRLLRPSMVGVSKKPKKDKK
tara:strand:+ start:639 stop:1313 length:675 start_codon:yes stop_codon:yes gene_type:complete